ncbi:hypothetical protein EYF80_036675 [Liparis tanakae]|uniref:Uncharacterized protein n=1 Tax=Liparis tanakae TaxID=230148 RepID=A0A4Z2GJN7_9TELE|nr:hypothetical protein EYF80_036675 [Liparis tanakae]
MKPICNRSCTGPAYRPGSLLSLQPSRRHSSAVEPSAGTAGGDETDLATSGRVPPDRRGFANMLVVTTTEGMLHGLQRGGDTSQRTAMCYCSGLRSSSKRTRLFISTGPNTSFRGSSSTENRTHECGALLVTYVHGHTTDTGPAVPLGLVLVVGATGLQDGLVDTTTSGNHT